jgi:hypothetical protein
MTKTFDVAIAHECDPTVLPSYTPLNIKLLTPYEPATALNPVAVPASLFPVETVSITEAQYSNVACGVPTYSLVNNNPVGPMWPDIRTTGAHGAALSLQGFGTDIMQGQQAGNAD